MHQGGVGVIFVYLLEWLKKSNWFPWVSQNSGTLNRWIGLAIAFGTSVGVKAVAEGTSQTGWHIALTIPPLAVMVDTLVHAATQFGEQQVLYHCAVKEVGEKS
jgi:hypothetical protein